MGSRMMAGRDNRGFTMVELMVGVTISAIVVVGAMGLLITTEKATRASEQVGDTQQTVRLAMDMIARDVKLAGYGMIGVVGACSIGGNAAAIVPLDQTPAWNDSGADTVRMVVPISSAVAPAWTLSAAAGGAGTITQLTLQTGAVAAMVAEAGGTLVGASLSVGGANTVTVTSVAGDTVSITPQLAPPIAFGAGMPVYLQQCVTYRVDTTTTGPCGPNAPCLLRNNVNIAEGVEDIQFEYACDGCVAGINGSIADGVIDNQNAVAGFDGGDLLTNTGDFVTNSSWATAPMIPSSIRLVRVFIVARQRRADQGMGEGVSPVAFTPAPLQVSDHNHAADAGYNAVTYSQFRRRVLTRTIEARNLGL